MDTVIAILGTLGGIAGVITAIGNIIFRVMDYQKQKHSESLDARLDNHLKPIEERLDQLASENEMDRVEIKEIRLDTTRTQLYFKMQHDTHNYDTILKIAYRYFVELHGDWVATVDFLSWADNEKVKIPSTILSAIAENDKKNHQ